MTDNEFFQKYDYLYYFARRKYHIDIVYSDRTDQDGHYIGCAICNDGTQIYTVNSHKQRVNVLLELMAIARAKRDT